MLRVREPSRLERELLAQQEPAARPARQQPPQASRGAPASRRRAARALRPAGTEVTRARPKGWEPNGQTRERYSLEFAFPHPCAREAAFYDDDAPGGPRLVGVGLFDATPRALSAAFFFHDPEYARFSLGTANILSLIDDARVSGRPHVYLGYRVEGCASLRYKAAFRPHELLRDRPDSLLEPPFWR